MLSYSQIGYQKLAFRNHTLKEEPKKATKHKKEKHDIKGVFTKEKVPNLQCQNNWDYRWKIRNWNSTRNKPNDCAIKLNIYIKLLFQYI